jgi:hypothetical protein
MPDENVIPCVHNPPDVQTQTGAWLCPPPRSSKPKKVPIESLTFTLQATRKAVEERFPKASLRRTTTRGTLVARGTGGEIP